MNGIIVTYYAMIGNTITIAGRSEDKAVVIGDNVLIGAGAKIIDQLEIM